MSEMRDVVEAMLDRLQVDLGTDVISTSLCSFDIASWHSTEVHPSLTKRVESLATSLRLCRSVGREFAVVAKTLAPILEAAKRNNISIPNRVAWSWVLVSEWRSMNLPSRYKILPGDLQQLICFYLSIKLNTTTLERDLGQLCRQIGGHQGPTAEDGSLASALVEVALDGPKCEQEMFEHHTGDEKLPGGLLPTPFARACAKLWLTCFGRRFRYKYRQSTKRPEERRPVIKGSLQAVHLGREAAASRLHDLARSSHSNGKDIEVKSFVPGFELPLPPSQYALKGTRWDPNPGAIDSKGMQQFKAHTERKRERALVCIVFLLLFREKMKGVVEGQ